MMREAFATLDPFDPSKQHQFTDDEIKQALQSDLSSSLGAFMMPNSGAFDYSTFFGDPMALSKEPSVKDEVLPSIEGAEPSSSVGSGMDAPVEITTSPSDQSAPNNAPPTSSTDEQATPQASTGSDGFAAAAFKENSADPFLVSDAEVDEFFSSKDALPLFKTTGSVPFLASPFDPAGQETNTNLDSTFHMHNANMPGQPLGHVTHLQHLIQPQQTPNGRRRSQTLPPDFEKGLSFSRQFRNSAQVPVNLAMPRHPMQPQPRHGMRLPPMPLTPRSFPITSTQQRHSHPMKTHDPHNDFMPPSRPQSLNPDLRMSFMDRARDLSPDWHRSRRLNKRQKHGHERMPSTYPPNSAMMTVAGQPNVDSGSFGMDQAMASVEFMLRDAVEKARYGRDEEVEKLRSESRIINSTIISLDAPLASMASKQAPEFELPKNGQDIKALNTQGVQALLDFFDIPFVSTMYLPDKKLLYLNFLGASGTLKHLVLD